MTDTQPFMDEARSLVDNYESGPKGLFVGIIRCALSSAYQRGREEEREECAKICDDLAAGFLVKSQNPTNSGEAADLLRIHVDAFTGSAKIIRTERDKG